MKKRKSGLGLPDRWTCDVCGDEIHGASAGWLEWLDTVNGNGERFRSHGLRIVHHEHPVGDFDRCKYNSRFVWERLGSTISDNTLSLFVGANGLTELLSWLDPRHCYKFPPQELLEIIKRLHVPGYEQARHHFKEAIADGVFEPNSLEGYHDQEDTAATIQWVREMGL